MWLSMGQLESETRLSRASQLRVRTDASSRGSTVRSERRIADWFTLGSDARPPLPHRSDMITPRTRHRTRSTRLAAIAGALLLCLSACSVTSGGSESDEKPEKGGEQAADDGQTTPGVLQELRILDKIVAVDRNGEEIDFSDDLLALASESAEEPVDFSERGSFAASSTFQPQLLDRSDQPVGSVDMVGGVIESDGEQSVAVLTTPNPGEWTIGLGYTLRIDIPEQEGVTDGTPLVVDYAYVQYLPVEGATGLEGGQSPLELMRARAAAGAMAFEADDSGTLRLFAGQVSVARAEEREPEGIVRGTAEDDSKKKGGAGQKVMDEAKDWAKGKAKEEAVDKADLPDGSEHLIGGIVDGADDALTGDCVGTKCVDNLLDKIEEGFKKSLKEIDDKLDFEPDNPDGPDGDKIPTFSIPPYTIPPYTIPDRPPRPPNPGPNAPPGPNPPTPPPPGDTPPGDSPNPPPGDTPPGDSPNPPPGDPPPGDTPPSDTPEPDPCPGCGGSSRTDPHIVTFDQRDYDLQVIGELTAARAGEFEVQVRYEPLTCSCRASITTSVAVTDGDHRVQLNLTDPLVLIVDGDDVDLDDRPRIIAGDLKVLRTNSGIELTDGQGTIAVVKVHPNFLNVDVLPGGAHQWAGLFGNANGDVADDFQTPDGENLGSLPRSEAINGEFADSWRVTADTSLFNYEDGESTASFEDATFPAPHPEVDAEDLESGRKARPKQGATLCRLAGITDAAILEDCVFDFTITGSPSLTQGNREAQISKSNALSREAEETPGEPTEGAGALTVPSAELAEEKGRHLVTGGGLALVREVKEDRTTLHALDIATRSERWTQSDVSERCRPVVLDGIGVVARLEKGSEALGDDDEALALFALDDGRELARFSPGEDDDLERCDDALVGDDDVVVHRHNETVRAFRVGDDITPLWTSTVEDAKSMVAMADGVLVNSWTDDDVDEKIDGTNRFDLLDLTTGEVTSSLDVTGGDPDVVRALGPDSVMATLKGAKGHGDLRAMALIDTTGGELRTVWVQGSDPDEPLRPARLAQMGDLLVGWTKHELGDGLVAYDISDGQQVWVYKTTSFDNTRGLVSATSERILVSPFGGAWLEPVDADGERLDLIEAPGAYAGPNQITPVGDDTILATGVGEAGVDGIYAVFIDV